MTLVEKMFTRLEVKVKSMRLETECLTLAARIGLEDREALLDLLGMVGLRYVWAEPGSLSIRQHTLAQIVLQEAIAQTTGDDLACDTEASLVWWLGPLVDCYRFARLALMALDWGDSGDMDVELPSYVKNQFEEEDWQQVAAYTVTHWAETDFALLNYFCNLPEAARKAVPAEFGHYLCALLHKQFANCAGLLFSLMLASLRAPGAKLDPIRMTACARKELMQKACRHGRWRGGPKAKSAEAGAAEADDAEADDARD